LVFPSSYAAEPIAVALRLAVTGLVLTSGFRSSSRSIGPTENDDAEARLDPMAERSGVSPIFS
jgi:hypothetical protein